MSFDEYSVELQEKLAQLKAEHKVLDEKIDEMMRGGMVDFVEMQRLKKRKLTLKDMISKLESDLLPDIIA